MAISYGTKVSKPDIDVLTVTDVDSTFSTKFSTLKILAWDDVEITTNEGGNGTVSIEHNFGYAPAHYVFRKGTASYSFLDASSYPNSFIPITGNTSLWMGEYVFVTYTTTTHLVIEARLQAPNTTYNFRYYLLIDLAQDYSGEAGITLVSDYGLKVSKDGIDVRTGKEYEMAYSQKYKSLQYYDENYKTQNLTLPNFWASLLDEDVEAGTYVDINHGLGYPPFFLAYAYGAFTSTTNALVPYTKSYTTISGNGGWESVDVFCDSTRVRISFIERSLYTGTTPSAHEFPAKTITIKCFIFTENLIA